MKTTLKLGTRGSKLALWQANWVKNQLAREEELDIEVVTVKTTGDRVTDLPLSKIGGKGLFTKELDQALLSGTIDFAVHSMKDLPFLLQEGLRIAAIPKREDHRDVLISKGPKLSELSPGATIGTSSLRRSVQLQRKFPKLRVTALRGNIDTRLNKLETEDYDGMILAAAGLKRLGYLSQITEYLESEIMISAIGQGALAVICRREDSDTTAFLQKVDHRDTRLEIIAERALLETLEGNCQTPIAGYARLKRQVIVLSGLIAKPDASKFIVDSITGSTTNAGAIGHELGYRLLTAGGKAILDEIKSHGT